MGWREPWEWLKNSWNSLVDAPIVMPKINSVEDLSEYVPGMTKEEVNQDIEIFNGSSKEDPSIDGARVETVNTTGDEPDAIENWARSVNIEPITVTDAEVDKVREIKEEEAEKKRQRNNLMNMALLDTTSFTAVNDVMQDDYDSWHNKGRVNQNIEVIGVTSINEGDLHIRVEENPSIKWDISVQSIQQSKNVLEAAVQGYKDWQSWLKNHEEQADLEIAKNHLQMFRIDPTNPEYDRQLREEIALWKQAKDDVMGFSGGIKVIQGVNKVSDVIRGASKATPYSNPKNRPSYGEGQVDEVWENAKQPDGKVYDPNTGEELRWNNTKQRNGQWDMGHTQENKYSEWHQKYMNAEITKEEFLDWYRNPKNYRPESPSANRSHEYE